MALLNEWKRQLYQCGGVGDSENWKMLIHELMTKNAAAKFDKIFLAKGPELYLGRQVSLAPGGVTSLPFPLISKECCTVRQERHGILITDYLTVIAVSRDDMRFKEFPVAFVIQEAKGKFLISDIHFIGDSDGSAYKQFLSEAAVIDSPKQFEGNHIATLLYWIDPKSKAPKLQSDEETYQMAIGCSPKFSLAYFQRAKHYYKNKQNKLALKDLDTAIKLCPDFENFKILRGEIRHEIKAAKYMIVKPKTAPGAPESRYSAVGYVNSGKE